MSKYIDGKIRFCPKCNKNINECTCQDNKNNKVKFVSLSQAKYNELMQKEKQNKEQKTEA